MATDGEGGGKGYQFACSLKELERLGRKRVTVEERVIIIFHVKGQVYALDHFCYHTGGPLELGDIEDSHGRLCVVCPWHKHSITLDTGESLYTAFDPMNPKKLKHNCSKGVKQRVHHIRLEGDNVMIKLSDLSQTLDSDRYFTEEYREMMENVLKEPVLHPPPGVKGQHPEVKVPIHSTRAGLPPPPRR